MKKNVSYLFYFFDQSIEPEQSNESPKTETYIAKEISVKSTARHELWIGFRQKIPQPSEKRSITQDILTIGRQNIVGLLPPPYAKILSARSDHLVTNADLYKGGSQGRSSYDLPTQLQRALLSDKHLHLLPKPSQTLP